MATGVRELWLADPEAATIVAVAPDRDSRTIGRGDRLSCRLLPGFTLDVARVFLG